MTPSERTKLAILGLGNQPTGGGSHTLIHRDEWQALRECVKLAECWDVLSNEIMSRSADQIWKSDLWVLMAKLSGCDATPTPVWRDELGVKVK